MTVKCIVRPSSTLDYMSDIRFTKINTKDFINISDRVIIIGGPQFAHRGRICVSCGHRYFPKEATKCFDPYG